MCVRLCRAHIYVLLLCKKKKHCELRVLKATENRAIACVGDCTVANDATYSLLFVLFSGLLDDLRSYKMIRKKFWSNDGK